MELLERFAQGELEAFETLFRQFQGQVYGWILRIVRDTGAAEDLTVETFWRIYRSRARFNPAGNFGAWTRRIATNVALDHLKTVRREVELPDEVSQGDRKSTRLNSSHGYISYAVFCLKKKKRKIILTRTIITT